MNLPHPGPAALQQSEALRRLIIHTIGGAGGWIPFAQYMELALYTPGLGYYCTERRKLGRAGDFVTAPEMTPLFARTLAVQVAELMDRSAPYIIECGAGSGILAVELLAALERLGHLPHRYEVLDVSADLRLAQRAAVEKLSPHLAERVGWLDSMPERFAGIILANEVLDAMPFHVVAWHSDGIFELGTCVSMDDNFRWGEQRATGSSLEAARALEVGSSHYISELGLAARAWVSSWAERLEPGALLLIDYGFPQAEYYHPQRSMGTLMCHYSHHSHDDPYNLPGLTDITAHVDFTAIADVGYCKGLELLGYTSQAQFLLNCGLADVINNRNPESADYIGIVSDVHKLISPAEMGELFKVMVLGRGIQSGLVGFSRGDRSHAL